MGAAYVGERRGQNHPALFFVSLGKSGHGCCCSPGRSLGLWDCDNHPFVFLRSRTSKPWISTSTATLSAPYLCMVLGFGAAKFSFADNAELLAGLGRERTFLKTADGIQVLGRDKAETYPCFWHFPRLAQQTALCGSCLKACCSHASLWELRPLYLGCCEFPMATQHLKIRHGLTKCSNALENLTLRQRIMDKGRSGKEIFMALDLLGFDGYTVIPVFVLCFFKTGLLYRSLNISLLLSNSVASGK